MLITSHFIHKKNGGNPSAQTGVMKNPKCDVGKSLGILQVPLSWSKKNSLILGEKKNEWKSQTTPPNNNKKIATNRKQQLQTIATTIHYNQSTLTNSPLPIPTSIKTTNFPNLFGAPEPLLQAYHHCQRRSHLNQELKPREIESSISVPNILGTAYISHGGVFWVELKKGKKIANLKRPGNLKKTHTVIKLNLGMAETPSTTTAWPKNV